MTALEPRRDQVAPVIAEPVETAVVEPETVIDEQRLLEMLAAFAEPLRRIPESERNAWHQAMTHWARRSVASSVDRGPHFHLAQRWLMTAELVWKLP